MFTVNKKSADANPFVRLPDLWLPGLMLMAFADRLYF